jgi:3'(2'), 5'-bisphosphate nucleotidase
LSTRSDISPTEATRLIDDLTAIVVRAAALVRAISPQDVAQRTKADQSPVTAADEASEAAIHDGLARLLPGVPVVSEEAAARKGPPALDGSFILVDPLDGTREFLSGSDEFAVLLAIVTGGIPIAGIIAAPRRGVLWRGVVGGAAERLRLDDDGAGHAQPIRARPWSQAGAVAMVSRSHYDSKTDAFLTRLGPVTSSSAGSAIKFCKIAEGEADVYPRLAPTSEWDVAAGHALVAAAGGIVTTPQGTALSFGHAASKFLVPEFIAWGDPAKAAAVLGEPG